MTWTSKDGPKCPVSREDRGEFMKPNLPDWKQDQAETSRLKPKPAPSPVSTTAQGGAGEARQDCDRTEIIIERSLNCHWITVQDREQFKATLRIALDTEVAAGGPYLDNGWNAAPPAPVRAAQEEPSLTALLQFVGWVESWVTNPVGAYSVHALDGLFHRTQERIESLRAPHDNPQQKGEG